MDKPARPGRFLGLGECMVELAPTADGTFRQGFAGDVFNTLWYAARLLGAGWTAGLYTALGRDALSDELIDFATRAGIDCSAAPRIAGAAPGLYMIRLRQGERQFLYWRGQSAARRMLEDPALAEQAVAAAEVVYLSGITLAILPPRHRERLIGLMAEAREAGKLVAFDPNIRPALWEDALAMRDTISRAAGAASLVLPSFDDEAATFGDADPETTVARYLGAGAERVVVKNGPAPVVTGGAEGLARHETRPLPGPVVDSTAAGDSFNAAFLAEWLRSAQLETAVHAGQSLAARVIQGHGALVDHAAPSSRKEARV